MSVKLASSRFGRRIPPLTDRAAAILEVLAEVSRRTQVIFFSHHEHLVDVARRTISPELLFVHRL
jgi:uncharacterized protein YhaN